MHELAALDAQTGRVAAARAGYEEALRLARELGDKAAQATELMHLGITCRKAGELVQAREDLTEALTLAQQVGDALGTARTLNSLGYLAGDEGNVSQACHYLREALAIFERMGSSEDDEPGQMLRELGREA